VCFLVGFEADSIDETIQSPNDGGVSRVESGDPFFGKRLVSGKGLQSAGREWRAHNLEVSDILQPKTSDSYVH
jgi:hypothetical protein